MANLFFACFQVMEKTQAYAEKTGQRVVFPKEILWLGGAPGMLSEIHF